MKSIPSLIVCTGLIGLCFGDFRYFPQIGDGLAPAAGFSFRTRLIFVNTADHPSTVELFVHADNGEAMELEFGPPLGGGSEFQFELRQGESLAVATPGTGEDLKLGYIRFRAPNQVGGGAVFSGADIQSGVVLFEAGVPAAAPSSRFTVFVDSLEDRNTGLAVVCPLQPGGNGTLEDEPCRIEIRLVDGGFRRLGSTRLEIPRGHKTARFVSELFQDDPEVADQASAMRGSLLVAADGVSVPAVTLRQIRVRDPFPTQVPVLTTFPVFPGAASSLEEEGWTLVWADEFEGTSPDPGKWEHQIGTGESEGLTDWGNDELQYYTARPENSRVEGGRLHITARRENFGDRHYTSARLRTREKGDWTYGRFEIRARLPKGRGMWPAVWMLPTDNEYGRWAASGEIDIMELVGHEPATVHGTLHHGGSWPDNEHSGSSYTLPSGDFSQDFHVFALEWEPGEFRWYVDGVHYQTQTEWSTDGFPFPAPFDRRFHLLVNLAVGGRWPGDPDATTAFPQELVIDYVRVYQRTAESGGE
jgi:beta-glucanase (GH16 family)